MPLIARVGRKAIGARLLIAAIYVVLLAGAITMVYPFLMMISGSFKSDVDKNTFDVVPEFLYDQSVLFRKHLECKYNNDITHYSRNNRVEAAAFDALEPPPEVVGQRVADWREFEQGYAPGPAAYWLGYLRHQGSGLLLRKHREFRSALKELCRGDIHELNRRFETENETWLQLSPFVEQVIERRYQLSGHPLEKYFYFDFKPRQPAWFRVHPSLDGAFAQIYLKASYGPNIADYNREHGTRFGSYREVFLSRTPPPEGTLARKDWERFVRSELNLQFIRVRESARPQFGAFLEERYFGDLAALNRRYHAAYASFAEVEFPADLVHAGDRLVDWSKFIETVPLEELYLAGPEFGFRDFLQTKYGGDLAALNAAHHAAYPSFDAVPMPTAEVDWADFLEHESEIRREFLSGNYKQVIEFILLHGRSLVNTVIYCALAVLTALTVNPLAAYALSRFKPPSTYKVLLFCMATMAFPPAVTMIPNFLLLKELGLLNTFAALILPGMASGFSIFLLKGFFDSIPRELYEAARLDGAGEWTMFWEMTMSISKPILAVIALQAFTMAYGNFMFAFIVCPSPKMWTLMVFLSQLQLSTHQAVTFAALLVAAIPTFLVFVLCQNVIIRGIVVPVEK